MHLEGSKWPNILYSCYTQRSSEGEQFVSEHIFSYILSGTSEIYVGGEQYHFQPGDFQFLRRNQLARFTKLPPADGEYKSISVRLDQDTLRSMSVELDLHADKPNVAAGAFKLRPTQLFKNYMDSLSPYASGTNQLSKPLITLKVKEAIIILLETNPVLKQILFDFTEPGKIDLQAYMAEHYRFNVDMNRFAYLTGRSLATFKRDFERIFNSSPSRWIQEQRLKDAYFLIREKGLKVSEVYLEVGFKDFSHFSFAFKKAFGIAPSRLNASPLISVNELERA